MEDTILRLDAKLSTAISRVERETQHTHRQIVGDLSKWKKDRETCWKHVGELKASGFLLIGQWTRSVGPHA